MDKPKRRGIPILPFAIVAAVLLLVLSGLILDRVEDPDRRRFMLQLLIGAFVGGLGLFSWLSVEWRPGRRNYRSGRFSEGAARRIATETVFAGNVWADTSTYRRPRRIGMDRKEQKIWAEVGRGIGLKLDRSRSPRLVGTIRGIEVRVDPVRSDCYETRARAALPISIKGKIVAALDGNGAIRIEGAPPDLEAALRDSPVVAWLTASGDATLEIEAQGARAFAPDIVSDPDLLRGLIELAVSAAESVAAWSRRK